MIFPFLVKENNLEKRKMSESASASAQHDPNESSIIPSVLDSTPGLNPVVVAALKHYAVIKDSAVTPMKKHAKSLSHETSTNLEKL